MGDMRRSALVIGCSDSDLRASIASDRLEGEGGGSNMSSVAINQMAEHHVRDQGTGRQRQKWILLRHGHRGSGSTVTALWWPPWISP